MTAFQEKVLEVVSKIAKGSVMSYQEVAHQAGFPRAYRAVGTLMAHNKNPAIPCHRVIRSDGVIGSYNRGGVERKKNLLKSEGVVITGNTVKR